MGIRYAKSDGLSIAYEVLDGAGPTLFVSPIISHISAAGVLPAMERFYERLCRVACVVRYDPRGVGLSDLPAHAPTLDDYVADLEAVRAAVGVECATFVATGSPTGLAYAMRHPGHVDRLVLLNVPCCDARDPEGTVGHPPLAPWQEWAALFQADTEGLLETLVASALGHDVDPREEAFKRFFRMSWSPSAAAARMASAQNLDLRGELRTLQLPTLVVQSRENDFCPVEHGRYLAARLPQAEYLELESSANMVWLKDDCLPEIARALEAFLTGEVRATADQDVVTVLYTDIVDSTGHQRARGEGAWRGVRQQFEGDSRRIIEHRAGRVIQFLGDGVLAAFPVPGEGLHAARSLVAAARAQGFEIRAGLHTGQVVQNGTEYSGLCLTVAARVMGQAGAGEILTTTTVQDLVEGFGFQFAPLGEVTLKGIGPRALVRLQ